MTNDRRCAEHDASALPRPHARPDARPDEGGDPACWLNQVCEECGRLIEDRLAEVCPNCGTAR